MLELKQGTQLADRYTLVRKLGGITHTQTWLANDRLTRALVALKVSDGSPTSRASLRAEWQASIRLMHPHIVRVFEFHDETDATFFSQQFIDGPNLGVIAAQAFADILAPTGLVADALAYIHGKGLVHRDIKASNILLDENGVPYLADFGVSCGVGQIGDGGSLIAQSPQSIAGLAATAADDIFSLGVLLFELISGRPPWGSGDIGDEIQHAPVPRMVSAAADGLVLPEVITALVTRMLAKDADERPTATEVGSEIRRAGFEPGPATIANEARRSSQQPVEEVIESLQSVRPVSRPDIDAEPGSKEKSTGLSTRAVGVALAALVAVLIGVIFVLPDKVPENRKPDIDVPVDSPPVVATDTDADGRVQVDVDPEIRRRVKGLSAPPTRKLEDDDDITFSENRADYSGLDGEGRARFDAETTLGELLSGLEVLESRGVALWAAREYRVARALYKDGDAAYLKKDFAYAEELYLGALTVLEPLYARIEPTFKEAYEGAVEAFDSGDRLEALRLFELAVAITPSHPGALAGYERARNLEAVLRLVEQGIEFEEDLELDAAKSSFEKALALDNLWQPAKDGIDRVNETRTKMAFDARMTDGFEAIAAGDYLSARAAFRVAQQLMPGSNEPADGLLQVDQGLRLQDIVTLESEAEALEKDEHWEAVVSTYEEILKVDGSLSFASEGLARGRKMSALHARLDAFIEEPDKLSVPSVMKGATGLVVDITTRPDIGPRLAAQRDELSRLLRRAATPLAVRLESDNSTDVFVYKVGKLGQFMRTEIQLRPGTYVVVGTRPGFRDVRLEFRVAPEISMEPVIVQCEERI